MIGRIRIHYKLNRDDTSTVMSPPSWYLVPRHHATHDRTSARFHGGHSGMFPVLTLLRRVHGQNATKRTKRIWEHVNIVEMYSSPYFERNPDQCGRNENMDTWLRKKHRKLLQPNHGIGDPTAWDGCFTSQHGSGAVSYSVAEAPTKRLPGNHTTRCARCRLIWHDVEDQSHCTSAEQLRVWNLKEHSRSNPYSTVAAPRYIPKSIKKNAGKQTTKINTMSKSFFPPTFSIHTGRNTIGCCTAQRVYSPCSIRLYT